MTGIRQLWDRITGHGRSSRNVALVLSGGGAKGWAHIGAIESLEAHGYTITSIAGTSMGALVGGLYAAGKMMPLKAIAERMTRKRMFQIMGISIGLDHIAKGERLMQVLDMLIGDICIEDLPIPFCCSASDLVSGEEVVFREGCLKMAIRASISIPAFFKPVCDGNRLLVDGSIHNTLPLNRVQRTKHDKLVAVNVSAPDMRPDTSFLKKDLDTDEQNNRPGWKKMIPPMPDLSTNYVNISMRVSKLTVQNNASMAMLITPPDIRVDMPMDDFNLFDFDKATALIDYGRQKMDEVLEAIN